MDLSEATSTFESTAQAVDERIPADKFTGPNKYFISLKMRLIERDIG
ncbi:MAG: hypothetical protein ACJAXW_001964 [Candidatus Azotimanducaceae bacterium]